MKFLLPLGLSKTLQITACLAGLFVVTALKAQNTWTGSTDSVITNAANWTGSGVPTFGGSNNQLYITPSGSANALTYTSAQGTTTFNQGGGGLSWFGQGGAAQLNITGGTMNFAAAFSNDGLTESIWLGNGIVSSSATVTMSGGAVNVTNAVLLGRDQSTGSLNITGGTFTVNGSGIYIGNIAGNNTPGQGSITLGGTGSLVLTGGTLSFGASTINNYINFLSGSAASLSIVSSSDNFSTLISNGYVKIGGVTATSINQFSESVGAQNVYTLASAIPEPSTYAAILGALAFAGVVYQRRRAKAA